MPRPLRQRDAFTAIAEPTRRSMLGLLEREPLPVTALPGPLGISQPAVSEHLRVLHEANLVSVAASGRERRYSLRAEGLTPVVQWIAAYEYWTSRLDLLGTLLAEEH